MHFNNHFYFRPPGFETAQFCLQNKDAISYQTFTGNALTLSKYNQSANYDKEIETVISKADLMILSTTFKSFKNIISFITHLKDTHINDCHNKMWNNSDMFTPSIFWFSRCPKQCVQDVLSKWWKQSVCYLQDSKSLVVKYQIIIKVKTEKKDQEKRSKSLGGWGYSGAPLMRPLLGHKILVVITRWSH